MNEENKIDVSAGQTLNFKADGKDVSGLIISSNSGDGVSAHVTVEITDPIQEGSKLSAEGCGGCGTAHIIPKYGRNFVTLRMSIEGLKHSTIGK